MSKFIFWASIVLIIISLSILVTLGMIYWISQMPKRGSIEDDINTTPSNSILLMEDNYEHDQLAYISKTI